MGRPRHLTEPRPDPNPTDPRPQPPNSTQPAQVYALKLSGDEQRRSAGGLVRRAMLSLVPDEFPPTARRSAAIAPPRTHAQHENACLFTGRLRVATDGARKPRSTAASVFVERPGAHCGLGRAG